MKHALITALVLATLPMTAAYAGKSGAPNQSQPTSSVITTSSATAAFQNASIPVSGITVTSISPSGAAQLSIQVPGQAGAVSVSAQVSPGGQVTITFADGSTASFNISSLQ